ncbi:alpha-1,2-fucosyltransferase [Paenibacillus sp. MMO-58]|uniref:alpha-1,2-fucosyltransferase n=1 Tax=Paenibacillus sp. MMO-58 TaxID=3081290 RepID=UPI0030181B40
MIVLRIENKAGLGNQLFMFAMAYDLSIKSNKKIVIYSLMEGTENRSFQLDKLMIDDKRVLKSIRFDNSHSGFSGRINKIKRRVFELFFWRMPFIYKIFENNYDECRFYKGPFPKDKKVYLLNGFFESYKYFDDSRASLIKQFIPKASPPDDVLSCLKIMKGKETVALHIRRGDFVKLNRAIAMTYYYNAINYIKRVYPNIILVLFTLDQEVKDELVQVYNNILIVDLNCLDKDFWEWYIMTQCKHNITSNSTFSWWAAYINNNPHKIVIAPDKLTYKKVESEAVAEQYDSFFLDEWVKLSD